MTRQDLLRCIHEPFGDAFYYGPERLSSRYEIDEQARTGSGFSDSTFKTVIDRLDKEGAEGKRLFIKDIAHYLVPPSGAPPSIAPSIQRKKRGVGTMSMLEQSNICNEQSPTYSGSIDIEPGNPTVIPLHILKQFHFTFLIRHPRYSIPSYFRCTVPPLNKVTGFHEFMPSEAGYNELRRVFEYLRSVGLIGPQVATHRTSEPLTNGNFTSANPTSNIEICVIDADDLLENPNGVIEAYCKSVGINFNEDMLRWESEAEHEQAKVAFEKWRGFHEDAINSIDLKPRANKQKSKSEDEENNEWREMYGEYGAKIIRETVNANIEDFEYLKTFALRV